MPLCARSHLQRWRKTITEIQIDQNVSLNARSRDCCAQEPTHFVPGKSFLDFKQLKSILSERIDFNGLFFEFEVESHPKNGLHRSWMCERHNCLKIFCVSA